MTTKPRFKIDFYDYADMPFALFFDENEGGYWGSKWRRIQTFRSRDDAIAFYDRIKELPEYLA